MNQEESACKNTTINIESIINEETINEGVEEIVESIIEEKPKAEKLWNNLYIKMLLIAMLVSICSNMLTTTLPLYIQSLGGDKSTAGLVMGVFTICALVMRPIYGNLVDTKGRKIILLIGLSIFAIACFGVSLTTSIGMILVLRGIQGLGFSGFSTAGGTVIADVLPSTRLNEGIGYYGIQANIATAVGPGLALVLIGTFGYNSIFITSVAICIGAFLLITTFNYEKKAKLALMAQPDYCEPEKVKFSIKTAFEKTALPGSFAQFFLIMPMGFIMTFIPTFGITTGISNVGQYFTVFAMTLLATRLFVGRLADKYGATKVIVPGIIMVFTGTAILAFTSTFEVLMFSGAIIGLGYGCINPTVNAFIIKVCPSSRRGAANATYYASFDAGAGFGSTIGGIIVQATNFKITFICLAATVLIGLFLFIKLLRKQILKSEAE